MPNETDLQITFDDKVDVNIRNDIPTTQILTAENINDIKRVVNQLSNELSTYIVYSDVSNCLIFKIPNSLNSNDDYSFEIDLSTSKDFDQNSNLIHYSLSNNYLNFNIFRNNVWNDCSNNEYITSSDFGSTLLLSADLDFSSESIPYYGKYRWINLTNYEESTKWFAYLLPNTNAIENEGSILYDFSTKEFTEIKNAINYSIISGNNNSLLENIGTAQNPDYRLRAKYNPGITIQLTGSVVENNATTINFTGNCMVVTDGNGHVVTRIGDNLNSSNFNDVDGTTNGTANYLITSTKSATPGSDLNSSTTTCTITGSGLITTAELIHFDNNTSTYFELDVFIGESNTPITYKFDSITGNNTYNAKYDSNNDGEYESIQPGITLTITNFSQEAKTDKGANGYQGKPTINITNAVLKNLANNQDICFSVRHINENEGIKSYGPTNKTFIITDTTLPSINGNVTCFFDSESVSKKICSGIEYITSGVVKITAEGINGLAKPAYVNQKLIITPIGGNWFTNFQVNGTTGLSNFTGKTTDLVSYSGTTTAIQSGYWINVGGAVAGNNVNGPGIPTSSALSTYIIDTIKNTNNYNPTSLIEYFKDESKRLSSFITFDNEGPYGFNSNQSISETQDLMVSFGELKYPPTAAFGQTFNNNIGNR